MIPTEKSNPIHILPVTSGSCYWVTSVLRYTFADTIRDNSNHVVECRTTKKSEMKKEVVVLSKGTRKYIPVVFLGGFRATYKCKLMQAMVQ